MWRHLILLASAGALGTLARHGAIAATQRWPSPIMPVGALVVNVIGSFAFGVVWALGEQRGIFTGQTRVFILIGFLGAFTTFSTYAFESALLIEGRRYGWAALHMLANNGLSILMVFIGLTVAGRYG